MKRIGILTFQRTLNYGAQLQCFALYEILRNRFDFVEVIDYRCERVEEREGLIVTSSPKTWIKVPLRKAKAKKFKHFFSEMSFTPRCNKSSIREVASKLDAIVVGSDQVWNLDCTGNDTTFFLDFIDDASKKKSYAASIGTSSFSSNGLSCKQYLCDFSSVLVREQTASKALFELCEGAICPSVVLDPTLLLTSDQWRQKAKVPAFATGRQYVLVYAISEFEKTIEAAKRVAEEKGLDIIQIRQYGLFPTPGVIDANLASPEEFLGLMFGADSVVVSSFHGVCFSVIAEKNFIYATDSLSTGKASRITDLLMDLEIASRDVDSFLSGSTEPIDYEDVRSRLSAKRQESLSKLYESLER